MIKKFSHRSYVTGVLSGLLVIFACFKADAQDVSQYDHGTPPQHAAGISAIGS